jgi:hypothetical protein
VDSSHTKLEDKLLALAHRDVEVLLEKDLEYGGSWKRRGGIGAFMMLARKWDRIETQVGRVGWDLFLAVRIDDRPEGVLDDIRDLRRYLALVEAELVGAPTEVEAAEEPPGVRPVLRGILAWAHDALRCSGAEGRS